MLFLGFIVTLALLFLFEEPSNSRSERLYVFMNMIALIFIFLVAVLAIAFPPKAKIVSTEEYSNKVVELHALNDVSSLEGSTSAFLIYEKFESKNKIKYVINTPYGKRIKETELGRNDYILEDNSQIPCVLEYYQRITYEPHSTITKFIYFPIIMGDMKPEETLIRTVYVIPEGSILENDYLVDLK